MTTLALCVNHISESLSDNVESMKYFIREVALKGAECIVFSEAALTGLINNDDPVHDYCLAITLDDVVIKEIFECCSENKIDIVFGFFERSGNSIYDSAVYFDHKKNVTHTYRRISSGWHGAGESSKVYRQGTEVKVFDTKIGNISFLICGDLFDDRLVETVRNNDSNLVIVPFARCFPEEVDNLKVWSITEKYIYADQVKKIGKDTVLVNYISGYGPEDYFGGVLFVGKNGKINAELPVFEKGILYVDI
ncbi:MAG: carbon-nitrogen hydrolase family protein [Candidatus Delongbacteria bacterium]|nr:carbon-nitrogen hydrolase family protein [Candidatus Delongbacteria bacterium]MCG2761311.1 carbon-nitrogen hydrolase family protein [Candidatus Delongbacteria bacterium]